MHLYVSKQERIQAARWLTIHTYLKRESIRGTVRWIGHTSSFLERQLSEIVSYRIFRIEREIQFARGCLCLRLATSGVAPGSQRRGHWFVYFRSHTHARAHIYKRKSLLSLRNTRIATPTYVDSGHSSAESSSPVDHKILISSFNFAFALSL